MKTFRCSCGARTFFDNTQCLTCGRALGFLPDALVLSSLEPADGGLFSTPQGLYKKCSNYVNNAVCNWMVPASADATMCQACQLNHVIPNLSEDKNRELWAEVEKAKRRLIYSLDRLRLPLSSKAQDPVHGLAFDIKAEVGSTRVLTGHEDGLITLNLSEADAPAREQARVAFKERYRTLLGHFRHEVGHYYWDILVKDSPNLARFRELFGDERTDYAQALQRHYASPPSEARSDTFISAYAASHPWEDFAETFAHYLHLADTLETAQDFGFVTNMGSERPVSEMADFKMVLDEWVELAIAMNALNRSMGQPDPYPFTIAPAVAAKVEFVHSLVRAVSQRAGVVDTARAA